MHNVIIFAGLFCRMCPGVNIKAGNNKVLGKRNFWDINREIEYFEHILLYTTWDANKYSPKSKSN